jgi:hypothetical protein
MPGEATLTPLFPLRQPSIVFCLSPDFVFESSGHPFKRTFYKL